MCARDELIKRLHSWVILIREDCFQHVETGKKSDMLLSMPGPWIALPDSDRDSDLVGSGDPALFKSVWPQFFDVYEVKHGARQHIPQ
jgi:hypothetical protein